MKHHVRITLILFFITASRSSAHSHEYTVALDELVAVGTKDMKTSHITFATSPDGQKYVIKQCKIEPHFFRPIKTILEMVALTIGYQMCIPLNKSWLVPVGTACIGKECDAPASLHEHLPGLPFDTWTHLNPKNKYLYVKIKQKEPLGLTHTIIKHMWKHKDLARIAAYDTFVGNVDRGMGNLFYDDTQDTFYGIDMGSAFSTNVCKATVENLKVLFLNERVYLTKDELSGLEIYYRQFKKMIKEYNHEKIHSMIDEMCVQARIKSENFLDSSKVRSCDNYILKCKKVCTENYIYAQELYQLLKQYLREKKKVRAFRRLVR